MMRTLFLIALLASLFLLACLPLPILPFVSAASSAVATESGMAYDGEPFTIANDIADIDARHEGGWDEFSKVREFTDGYQAMGQAWGDYDNDGWVDLFVTGGLAANTLYRNNGDGTFSIADITDDVALSDLWSGGASWADYDNDGWRDLYVLGHGANVLLRNDEGLGFTNITVLAGVGDTGKSETASWGDYDADGFLDLYVANWACYPACDPVDDRAAQDRLYHNLGDGTFEDVSDLLDLDKLQGAGFSVSFVDYDDDSDPDIYVVNDKLHKPVGNVLWRNDGPGCDGWCWTDVSAETDADIQLHGMGLAIGDYDNDQDLDFYVSNMVEPSILLRNDGGVFNESTGETSLPDELTDQVGWGTAFIDYDNDGHEDLVLATTAFIVMSPMEGPLGMLMDFPNALFRNTGDGAFVDETPQSWLDRPAPGMGLAYADYDQDGDVDFITGDWNQGYSLYRNDIGAENRSHWLAIRLIGGGRTNRDAVGSRVYVTTTDGRTLMKEVISGSSLGAGNDTMLHFGLGDSGVERVQVAWPDGTRQNYDQVDVDQVLEVAHALAKRVVPERVTENANESVAEAIDVSAPVTVSYPLDESFLNVSVSAGITAAHGGYWDMFNPDFESGYLGIGQAWGDYDNDGWIDLYVSGNLTDSVLYHNERDGTFSVSALSEDVSLPGVLSGGASWADFDNDGWTDLYVLAHGRNALLRNHAGQGFVDVAKAAGVDDDGKGMTATWGDYDNDGLLDLYVANWACWPECEPLDTTRSQDVLYHNDGDGTFTDVSHLLVFEKLLGTGFTASFVDYDNDGDLDIYVINDDLKNPIGNVLWRNDGPGCGEWCWSDASAETGADVTLAGMGLAVGDYDNDQDLDFYFTNMVNAMVLLDNQSGALFDNVAKQAGVAIGPSSATTWGTSFFDYDNDGWLDLYVTATEFVQITVDLGPEGMHFAYPDSLFRNNGDRTFTDVTPQSWLDYPSPTMGFAYADYNKDGHVDFAVGNWNEGYQIYRNQGMDTDDNNWLTVKLIGGGPVNRDAIGSRVYLLTADGRTLMQEVKSGSSLGAGNDTAIHFGLGESTVDELSVVWPNGNRVYYRGVSPNQEWTLEYPGFE